MAKKRMTLGECFNEFYRCVEAERARELGEFFKEGNEVGEATWEDRLKKLLQICGKPGVCKGCKAEIYWMATRRDAVLPYTKEGLPHFADCPKASEFRKVKNGPTA